MDTMLIKREDFSKFLNSIELIQDHCNDAEILDGKLRQRSNDKYTVFDFDFSNAVGGLSFMVSGLKNKISLLRSLELDTALLSDEETEKNIIVSVVLRMSKHVVIVKKKFVVDVDVAVTRIANDKSRNILTR